MNPTFAIAQRDFKGFFGTPLGWIAACLIFLISGFVFQIVTSQLLARGQAVDPVSEILGQILGFLHYINIFIIPAFTMRSMSEELNSGTYRLQAAAPISSWSVVFGKFFGVMFYFGVLSLLMLIYPLYVFLFSTPDLRVMLAGWLGLILNVASIASIGLFVGSLTKNPVISYLGSAFFIILFIFSVYFPGMPEWYTRTFNLLDLGQDLTRGIVKTGTVAVYLAIVMIFLFLARFVMESKRWRV